MRLFFGQRQSRAHEDSLVWLARLKRGLRHGEGAALLAWLKRRSHRNAIAKAAAEWHGPEVLAVLSEIFPISPDILKPRRGRLATAAIVSLGVTMAISIAILFTAGLHRHVYTTAPGAIARVILEDGTLVKLNRGTQIKVTYVSRVRSVEVAEGEALFKVANKPNRPFYLHAAGRNFEAGTGTFDVRFTAPHALTLTVLEGTVTVFPAPVAEPSEGGDQHVSNPKAKPPILLEPLQMLLIEDDRQSGQTLTEQDVRSRLSWQRGI